MPDALDDYLYQYASAFFTINVGLLAFLAQLLSNDKRALDPPDSCSSHFNGFTKGPSSNA
jgi:hypothetical protein